MLFFLYDPLFLPYSQHVCLKEGTYHLLFTSSYFCAQHRARVSCPVLLSSLSSRCGDVCYYPHFTEEEIEAHPSEAISPRPTAKWLATGNSFEICLTPKQYFCPLFPAGSVMGYQGATEMSMTSLSSSSQKRPGVPRFGFVCVSLSPDLSFYQVPLIC